MNANSLQADRQRRLYAVAFGLAVFTILFNIAEGLVSTYFGYEDESFTLLGFGVDSFIEVISGTGIAHMVMRIRRDPQTSRDRFESTALRVTGFAFYALTAGLVATGIYNAVTGHKPETALWGVIISLVSIATMWALIYGKTRVGRELNSGAILADAECTRVCIYMSVVLLAASAIYELTRFPYMDTLGTLGLAFFSFREGQECFQKAKGNAHCGCCRD